MNFYICKIIYNEQQAIVGTMKGDAEHPFFKLMKEGLVGVSAVGHMYKSVHKADEPNEIVQFSLGAVTPEGKEKLPDEG